MSFVWIPLAVLLISIPKSLTANDSISKEAHKLDMDTPEDYYGGSLRLRNDLLHTSRYNPTIRPVVNKTTTLMIDTYFELVSITDVDEDSQSVLCNGFMVRRWRDERLSWNPLDYGGVNVITPYARDVFTPQLRLVNAINMKEKEIHNELIEIDSTGDVVFVESVSYESFCEMDLTYFPFDAQTCNILLVASNYNSSEIFHTTRDQAVSQSFFIKNRDWEISAADIESPEVDFNNRHLSTLQMKLVLKRNPTFHVLSVLSPVMLISMLNLLVFIIPHDKGDKVGYGTTVLLALVVYMSSIASMMPQSSNPIPLVIIYILILLIISVFTVLAAVIVVKLYQKVDQQQENLKENISFPKEKVRGYNPDWRLLDTKSGGLTRGIVNPNRSGQLGLSRNDHSDDEQETAQRMLYGREDVMTKHDKRFEAIARHANRASFVIFALVWLFTSIGLVVVLQKHADN